MNNLKESHKDVHIQFLAGNFTIHQTAGNFNGVGPDLALEQTYNNEGKSLFKGISLNERAREKYIKTTLHLTKISESIKSMAHMDSSRSSRSSHHRHSKTETMKDIETILNMVQMVKEKMINPFTYNINSGLVNIATGEKRPPPMMYYLLLVKVKQLLLMLQVRTWTKSI